MAINIPTTQELTDQFIASYESKLNQDAPLNDRAFLRVQAAIEAMLATGLYKYATERSLQNFAITATGSDLDRIGAEYGIIRKPAESTQLTIDLPALDATVIPVTVDFVGDANGVRYSPDSSSTASGGSAIINVTAKEVGSIGNLNVAETLTISNQIPGAETTATITSVDNLGTQEESDESYRARILDAIRLTCGGSNAADYKIWAEGVSGVQTAFPYAGKPFGDPGTSYPGERTVYIEATTDIDDDGIAPQSLLDEVRQDLNYDPITGLSRPALGLTDSTLYVKSISRTDFYITISGLNVPVEIESEVKAQIETGLELYFRSISPFVDGIDIESERNDLITDLTVSKVVQDILAANGGSAQEVAFGFAPFFPESQYRLQPGELAKLADGGISYVA